MHIHALHTHQYNKHVIICWRNQTSLQYLKRSVGYSSLTVIAIFKTIFFYLFLTQYWIILDYELEMVH